MDGRGSGPFCKRGAAGRTARGGSRAPGQAGQAGNGTRTPTACRRRRCLSGRLQQEPPLGGQEGGERRRAGGRQPRRWCFSCKPQRFGWQRVERKERSLARAGGATGRAAERRPQEPPAALSLASRRTWGPRRGFLPPPSSSSHSLTLSRPSREAGGEAAPPLHRQSRGPQTHPAHSLPGCANTAPNPSTAPSRVGPPQTLQGAQPATPDLRGTCGSRATLQSKPWHPRVLQHPVWGSPFQRRGSLWPQKTPAASWDQRISQET